MRVFGLCLFALYLITTSVYAKTETAIFAGGCFWCLEADMDKVPGVLETISGYTGGKVSNPTYQQVSNGGTGHFESVKVIYNTDKVTYQQLVNVFWHHIDPTDSSGQFCDKGDQYRSAIFYLNSSQKRTADASKQALIKSKKLPRVATLILPAGPFYPAENYHQDYYQKNPLRYKYYRYSCGRDQRVNDVWGNS